MIEVKYFGIRDIDFHFRKLETPLALEALRIREMGQQIENPDVHRLSYKNSRVDSFSKWTEECEKCLAVLVCGKSKSGEVTSFLSHAGPEAFRHCRDNFKEDYKELLLQLNCSTVSGTRDSLICGSTTDLSRFIYRSYEDIINNLAAVNFEILGAKTFFLPPKTIPGTTNLYFNGSVVYVVETGLPQASYLATPMSIPVDIVSSGSWKLGMNLLSRLRFLIRDKIII